MTFRAGNPPLGTDVQGAVLWAHTELTRVGDAFALLDLIGAGGSSVPATRTITGINSVQGGGDLSADRTLELVGDVAAPGNTMLYGTNAAGVRGWYPQPSGGGGTVGEAPIDTARRAQEQADASAADARNTEGRTLAQMIDALTASIDTHTNSPDVTGTNAERVVKLEARVLKNEQRTTRLERIARHYLRGI